MIKNTTFVSKKQAEDYYEPTGKNTRVLISLTTPPNFKSHTKSIGCSPANLHEDTWKDILRLEFHDADPHKDSDSNEYKVFSVVEAVSILKFLKLHEDSIEDVIVHCEAGISRSAGVSKFIAELYKLKFPQNYSVYNKHVFSTLMSTYVECLYNTGPLKLEELPFSNKE